MTGILEFREKLKSFYSKYDIFVNPLLKFILAFGVFFSINKNLGFVGKLSGGSVTLALSLVCAIIPVNFMILLAAALIVLQLYSLSLEVALIALLLFVLLFLLYFRFAPRDGVYTVLTPICFGFQIGPVMPMAVGLLQEVYSVLSVLCGTVVYFFLSGVVQNASVLGEKSENTAITSKFTATLNQFLGNKEMYLMLVTFFLVSLIVYVIRKLSIDYAWTIAIVTGALVNFIVLFAGYLMLGISGKTMGLVIGTLVSLGVAFLLEFMFFNLDYSRTERVQFEDDEYYYYVKAVPKMYVPEQEKQVKKINSKSHRSDSGRELRRRLSEEMDIDEDMFR
ncbi:MAG: hypothetical protein NC307_06900 [Roseburia sp.]|nr:hypothetical protein [Roseburia sp.]